MKYSKFLNYLGIFGPVYYFVLLFILGKLWEGYNPISQSMSVIGAVDSPFKHLMNFLGFSFIGILLIIFAYNYRYQFGNQKFETITFISIMIAGSSMYLVGFFPCDSMCVDVTVIGELHSITSTIPAIFLPLAAILSATTMNNNPLWGRNISYSSFILGLLSLSSGLFMYIPASETYIGVIQRSGIGLSLLWVVIVSMKMEVIRKNS